jgi:hypothetical protein
MARTVGGSCGQGVAPMTTISGGRAGAHGRHEREGIHAQRLLPPRALALIVEWASLHEAELLANWERCRRREAPVRIPPLE